MIGSHDEGEKLARRSFLAQAGMLAGAALLGGPALAQGGPNPAQGAGGPLVLRGKQKPAARLRPDLLAQKSPPGLEVYQLTAEPDVPSSHLYMEAQVFSPDSRRFVLHRSATAHGGSQRDPKHQYLLCDLDDGMSLTPLTEETGVTGASMSPDGQWVYYFLNETRLNGGRLELRRVKPDATGRETVLALDGPVPGTKYRFCQLYPLSTISSDGKRIAISGFLGDGVLDPPPWGILVFDIERASVALILEGPTWCNMHPQYCRSTDPEASHDLLVQENHGNVTTPQGAVTTLVAGQGADIHVIRDDGTNFRNMPWGRDGNEACQGHQCWRGRSTWAITSTGNRSKRASELIEGSAAPHTGHVGIATPGGVRNDLSRSLEKPAAVHFATDIAGTRLITDMGPLTAEATLWVADLGKPGEDALAHWTYLLCPRSTCQKQAHIHPFLSPDATMGFFNSDETGILQAYMVRHADGPLPRGQG